MTLAKRGARRGAFCPTRLLASLALVASAALAWEAADYSGPASTPYLGFLTERGINACEMDTARLRQISHALKDAEIPDAGYEFFVVEDCWQDYMRTSEGKLREDMTRFRHPIRTSIAETGMKLGLGSSAGYMTCQGRPGSEGHEADDLDTMQQLGAELIMYSNCGALPNTFAADRFGAMAAANAALERPLLLSTRGTAFAEPWTWGTRAGHAWRVVDTKAVEPWGQVDEALDARTGLPQYAGPGRWHDMGPIYVRKDNADRVAAQLALWAVLKSPILLTGRATSVAMHAAVVTNPHVLAIHQDPAAIPGDKIHVEGNLHVYGTRLLDGDRVVAIQNRNRAPDAVEPDVVNMPWAAIGLDDNVKCDVYDVALDELIASSVTGWLTHTVPLGGVLLLRIQPRIKVAYERVIDPSDCPIASQFIGKPDEADRRAACAVSAEAGWRIKWHGWPAWAKADSVIQDADTAVRPFNLPDVAGLVAGLAESWGWRPLEAPIRHAMDATVMQLRTGFLHVRARG